MFSRITRYFFFTITLFASLASTAQKKSAPLASWIPAGWTILDSAQGDLNGDGHTDFAFALESPKTIRLSEKNAGTALVHPRRFLLLYGADTGFTVHFRSDKLIPYKYGTWEPFENVAIPKAGQLLLSFGHQYPYNSEFGEHVTYQFRREGDRWLLIGAEYEGNEGRVWDYVVGSYNFLTGKRSWQRNAVDEEMNEKPGKLNWARFPAGKPIYLDGLTGPFSIMIKQDGIAL